VAESDRISAEELALRAGAAVERIRELVANDVLEPGADGRFEPGDVHRVRLLTAFDGIGVPLEAMQAASREGRISLRYYDQLHPPPRPLSGRSYAAFASSLGERSRNLNGLFAAFGIAEPAAAARLEAADEALLTEILDIVDAIGETDLALRAIRLLGEGARRAADGALGVYAEAVDRSVDELAGLPVDEVFQSSLWPWARFAREAPALADWLVSRHLSRAVDEYSVTSTERILEEAGYIPARTVEPPAVAFVDLTGFTRLTEERGDDAAAAIALRLGEVATGAVTPRGGRVVKLLGDGVLLRFDDTSSAVEASLDLLAALPAAGLPTGHAGVAAGSLIVRDNDVFGRTVNLAARIADVTPDGRLYLPAAATSTLAANDRWTVTAVEPVALQGIGRVELMELKRTEMPA